MKRSLDTDHLVISCQHGHPLLVMKGAYYSLKEAGAPRTILGFSCSTCFRTIYVTDDYACVAPSREVLAEMDAQE